MQGKFIDVKGIKTHYHDLGAGDPVVLLHSGEFGADSETTWELTMEPLARHFRVLAPDWLGYGLTEKLFDFEDMFMKRVQHIADFLQVMGISNAHFVGNSMGGSTLLTVAAMDGGHWPIRKIVLASGGGLAPDNDARKVLNTYDMTKEHMRRVLEVLILRPELRDDPDYLERRYQKSLIPGAWECTAAVRFKPPGQSTGFSPRRAGSTANVRVPTLLIAGARDPLRNPGYAQALVDELPNGELALFEDAGHCPQLDCPEAFNERVIAFLKR